MKLTNKIKTLLLFISVTVVAQNEVCTGDTDLLQDLNSIGKCAIENFKKSNTKEFIQVSSRSRYVREKKNVHLNNFKKNVKLVSKYKKPQKKVARIVKEKDINTGKVVKGENLDKELDKIYSLNE